MCVGDWAAERELGKGELGGRGAPQSFRGTGKDRTVSWASSSSRDAQLLPPPWPSPGPGVHGGGGQKTPGLWFRLSRSACGDLPLRLRLERRKTGAGARAHSLLPVGAFLGPGRVEREAFLCILARRTWRSWCHLTCGGCVASALLFCPRSSEEAAPPAGSEWSRGRGKISVSGEYLCVLIPASWESFGICGSLPGFLSPRDPLWQWL